MYYAPALSSVSKLDEVFIGRHRMLIVRSEDCIAQLTRGGKREPYILPNKCPQIGNLNLKPARFTFSATNMSDESVLPLPVDVYYNILRRIKDLTFLWTTCRATFATQWTWFLSVTISVTLTSPPTWVRTYSKSNQRFLKRHT